MRGSRERSNRIFDRLIVGDRYQPILIATLMMLVVFAFGVTGYELIGFPRHGFLDAVYMAVITLTTVGYGEVIEIEGNPVAQVFTMALLFFGVGTFLYFFSTLTSFIVEGNLEHLIRRRKMEKAIRGLRGHYIVCGGGHTGEHIVRELLATARPFVLIESNEEHIRGLHERLGSDFPAITGDATHDETLLAAGIEHAAGLFAAISSDKDNLIITISARLLQPALRIVSRSTDESVERKIRKAGADVVISPSMIGGLRMTSEMVRPNVVTFLDVMMRDRERRLRVEESTIAASSELDGLTAGELRKRAPGQMLLVAIRSEEGDWHYNPPDSTPLVTGLTLVYLGSPAARIEVDALAGDTREGVTGTATS